MPRGIRGRLAAAIVLVAVATLGGSFYVLHERTGADLGSRIDGQLRSDLQEFESSPAGQASTPGELRVRAREFVRGQAYHPDSRIFAIEADGPGGVVSNSEELIETELGESEGNGAESGDGVAPTHPTGILAAPTGLVTVSAGGDDEVRVLTQPVVAAGRRIGTFHVAESLGQIGIAQDSLRSAFLVVGAVALSILLAAAIWIATLVARPLHRMADFATEVDTGRLDRRLANDRGPAEVRSLSDSLNRMLDRLQSAFEREREFVADASHELRTPITIAQGELDLLRRDAAGAQRERLDVVRRELKRMERLISEMLTLAREDAGRSLAAQPIDLADLLADLRRDLPLMGERDYRVSELTGTIDADPDRLAQVLRNLLQNAVTHTEPGGLIEVKAQADGDTVRFEICDDGPGIPDEEAAHLFDRFYRSNASSSRDRRGTGLGLAIARAIVEAHGGRIWAEPPAAGGARVIFELPGYHAA
jgi:two-component system OmpR family sensor kinase